MANLLRLTIDYLLGLMTIKISTTSLLIYISLTAYHFLIEFSFIKASIGVSVLISILVNSSRIFSRTGSSSWKKLNCIFSSVTLFIFQMNRLVLWNPPVSSEFLLRGEQL